MNIIYEALGVMQERGFAKYTTEEGPGGKVCIGGAMLVARGIDAHTWNEDVWRGEEAQCISRVAREMFPERGGMTAWDFVYFNNHSETTQEDVELVLKHAAYEWDLLHHN